MAKITIRAKNLRTLLQQAKDTHTRNVTLKVLRGKLTASLYGWDKRAKPITTTIVIEQEEKNGKD